MSINHHLFPQVWARPWAHPAIGSFCHDWLHRWSNRPDHRRCHRWCARWRWCRHHADENTHSQRSHRGDEYLNTRIGCHATTSSSMNPLVRTKKETQLYNGRRGSDATTSGATWTAAAATAGHSDAATSYENHNQKIAPVRTFRTCHLVHRPQGVTGGR